VHVEVGVERPEVVLLLSGGIDSTACLAFHVSTGRQTGALFVDYGQGAAKEEEVAARAVACHYDVTLRVLRIVGARQKGAGEIAGRNAFLIATAAMECEEPARVISIGIRSDVDYPDCSRAFVEAILSVMAAGMNQRLRLATPLMDWTKAEVFEYCRQEDVPTQLTYSCEVGGLPACGRCSSCQDMR